MKFKQKGLLETERYLLNLLIFAVATMFFCFSLYRVNHKISYKINCNHSER